MVTKGLPCSLDYKSACNAGDLGLIPGLGRSSREGNGNPLQYSCLGNPMDYAVRGILQTRILEWVAFPFSRGPSQLRDRDQVSYMVDSLLAEPQGKPIFPYNLGKLCFMYLEAFF